MQKTTVKRSLICMGVFTLIGCGASKDMFVPVEFPTTKNPEYVMDIPEGYTW